LLDISYAYNFNHRRKLWGTKLKFNSFREKTQLQNSKHFLTFSDKNIMRFYSAIIILFYLSQSHSGNEKIDLSPSPEYVRFKSLKIIDPNTRKVIGHLEGGTKIIPHIVMRNNKPLLIWRRIYVGFSLPGKESPEKGVVGISGLTTKESDIPREPPLTPAMLEEFIRKIDNNKKTKYCNPQYYKTSNVFDLIKEFHNTTCNRKVPQGQSQRKGLLRKWDHFVREKSQVSKGAHALAKKAREIDIATRTALYEGNIDNGCTSYAICERDIILLTIRNRAKDKRCRKSYRVFGCKRLNDFAGIASSPSQYSIWSENFMNNTYITSCFLRDDLSKNNSPTREGEKDYRKKIKIFKNTIQRAEKILYSRSGELEKMFKILNKKKGQRLNAIKHYYHPEAMPRCNPDYYSKSALIEAAYVEMNGKYYLLRQRRIIPEKSERSDMYSFKVFAPDTLKPLDLYPGGQIHRSFIDFRDHYTCTSYGVPEECYDQSSSDDITHRKMPDWYLRIKSKGSWSPELMCNISEEMGEDCSEEKTVDAKKRPVPGGFCNKKFIPVGGVW